MGKYFDELKRAMDYLAEQPDTMFLGQAVAYKGTAMTNTLSSFPSGLKPFDCGAQLTLSTPREGPFCSDKDQDCPSP